VDLRREVLHARSLLPPQIAASGARRHAS
jgi:hypothetical protein